MQPHPLASGQGPRSFGSRGVLFINPVLVSHNTQVMEVRRESWLRPAREGDRITTRLTSKRGIIVATDFTITNVNLQDGCIEVMRLRGGSLQGSQERRETHRAPK